MATGDVWSDRSFTASGPCIVCAFGTDQPDRVGAAKADPTSEGGSCTSGLLVLVGAPVDSHRCIPVLSPNKCYCVEAKAAAATR